uniref:Uncharacterized protein n=1 Tax=Phlebotomus papatasi TaxID=29031 RepID=A0A1B0EY09_PHLPP
MPGNGHLVVWLMAIRARMVVSRVVHGPQRLETGGDLPVVLYGCESWTLNKLDEDRLNCFERKILRRIYGPVEESRGEWRIRHNHELYDLFNDHTIVGIAKSSRLRWAGHIMRMPNNRVVRKIFEGRPVGSRTVGRPRKRWEDDVDNDARKINVRNWRALTSNRENWRRAVEEAKALHGL